MVRGLDIFRTHFAGHADQYVLIGGTAATLAMEGADLEFRATKDLDIVLHIEALRPEFGAVFWSFVEAGGYEVRQASVSGKPVFYRFQKPADPRFPAMLELFGRAPDGIKLAEGSHLTPIPVEAAAADESAVAGDVASAGDATAPEPGALAPQEAGVDPWGVLLQAGAQLVSALSAAGDAKATPPPWVERDPATGACSLRLPLPPPQTARRIADALSVIADLLRRTKAGE